MTLEEFFMLIRKSYERGKNNIAWLDANHSFSFGHYYDPQWTNFHKLLVINEDTISPAMGFGTHPHKDMEIITYVIDGEIKHRDSMGSLGVITPGEIQVMSAGTGVAHSEHNNLTDRPTHLLQIWVHPIRNNLTPRYAQKRVYENGEINFFKVIAGAYESADTIGLNAEAQIYLGKYDTSSELQFVPKHFEHYWLQLVSGDVKIDDNNFTAGDGIGFSNKEKINIQIGKNGAEFLILEVG